MKASGNRAPRHSNKIRKQRSFPHLPPPTHRSTYPSGVGVAANVPQTHDGGVIHHVQVPGKGAKESPPGYPKSDREVRRRLRRRRRVGLG